MRRGGAGSRGREDRSRRTAYTYTYTVQYGNRKVRERNRKDAQTKHLSFETNLINEKVKHTALELTLLTGLYYAKVNTRIQYTQRHTNQALTVRGAVAQGHTHGERKLRTVLY